MTETVCSYSETKELHLYNIISVAEDKLQTNFARILVRLNNHEKQLRQNKNLLNGLNQKISQVESSLCCKINEEAEHNVKKFQSSHKQIQKLQNLLKKLTEITIKNQNHLSSLQKSKEDTKIFLDTEFETRNQQYQGIKQKIRNMQMQVSSLDKLLDKKENVIQSNKTRQIVGDLNYQIGKLGDEQKFVQFKLDKFELNNQKNQKNQITKEISFMRDLQEKMKSEIKNCVFMIQKMPISNNAQNVVPNGALSIQQIPSNEKRFNIQIPKQSSIINTSNIQINQKSLTRMNELMNQFERKIQICESQLKQLSDIFENFIRQKKSNATELQQKINAVRPEFIKIWSKCDTIQDKNAFLQRKLQQKNKQIIHILQVLKQTQSSKFEDKLKMFQTQIFGKLQEEKIKVEGKLNSLQFQRFSKNILDRVQNLNDQVVVKSDKIEVKKALLFLESKIKEIILVISEDEEQEKDALLTKKQIKCISCDKEIEKFIGLASNVKGNWDAFPLKQHSPDMLGRFGMTSYGSLARKLKRLDCKQISVLPKRSNKQSIHSESKVGN